MSAKDNNNNTQIVLRLIVSTYKRRRSVLLLPIRVFLETLLVFKLSDLSEPVGLWGGLTTPEKLFLRLINRMTIRVSRRVVGCSAVRPAFVKPRSVVVSGAKGCQFRVRH